MRGQMDACANKADKIVLARNFGYGIPSLSRALSSAENDLFMISQAEITPYYREEREDEEGNLVRTAPKMKDLHVYQLPWPIEALQTLGAKDVHLKVTLCILLNRILEIKLRYFRINIGLVDCVFR